jgi:small subunit ribosomal protein S18
MAFQRRARALEGQASRNWASGDTYAPHDLSSTEMLKARAARFAPRASNLPPANTRKRGGKDVLDDLGIDPRKEYKNFGFIGEFVTEMGRIRHGRETGLRGVNQRRVAKAVRRAVGVGIMPSVHRHPEMHETRMLMRGNARTR